MEGDQPAGRPVEFRPRQPQAREGGPVAPPPAALCAGCRDRRSAGIWSRHAFPAISARLRPFGWATDRAGALAALRAFHRSLACPRFGDEQDAMLAGRTDPLPRPAFALPQPRASDPDGGVPAGRSGVAAGRGATAMRPKGSSARSSAGANLCVESICYRGQTIRPQRPGPLPRAAAALLGRRRPDGLPVRSRRADPRPGLCPSHTAPDGDGQLRASGRGGSLRRCMNGICPSTSTPLNGSRHPTPSGMSQFADGGVVGSKPYVSSGAYIDRMSDYCGGCAYRVKEKTGPMGLPVQPALLALPDPPPRQVSGQPADGADVPHLGRDGRWPPGKGACGGRKGACPAGRGRGGLSPCGRWVNLANRGKVAGWRQPWPDRRVLTSSRGLRGPDSAGLTLQGR